MQKKNSVVRSKKTTDLSKNVVDSAGQQLTTDLGIPINDDHNTLKAGNRGPTLLQDFIFGKKIQHFDRGKNSRKSGTCKRHRSTWCIQTKKIFEEIYKCRFSE